MTTLMQFWAQLVARPDFWGFVSIPIVAAVVTWVHVWCAIQMVFYPLEFIGVAKPWLGWQGIIPRKARKMSDIIVEKSISKLGSVSEFLKQMEPEKVAERVVFAVTSRIEDYTDEVMMERHRVLWENLPMIVKRRVYNHVRRELPAAMDKMVAAIIENIDDLVDVEQMCGDQMEADKGLIVRMFQEVGRQEFRFIVNVSFWIGLAFGFVQMVLFYFVPWHGLLPLYAAVLGLATNWIALAMVFRPLHPVKVGPFTMQGMFLRRQEQVADKFAEMTSMEMLTIAQFMREILTGKRADKTRQIIKKHLAPLLETPVTRTLIQVSMGPTGYSELKDTIADKTPEMALDPLSDKAFNISRAKLLAQLFAQRIKALSREEFQDLLRPAFQEDEWILLVLGAVTGLIAGYVQLLVGFK